MKIKVKKISENPLSLLRRAGYTFQRKDDGEMGFIRSLAQGGYPRFHLYSKVDGTTLYLTLHLDQKKHTYGENTRHHGEYENDGVLKEEGLRLQKAFGNDTEIE